MTEEVAALARNPSYTDPVSGVTVTLTFIWGGDMKYLLMVYGLCSATSLHPCLYCVVSKNHFHQGANSKMNTIKEKINP